MSAVILRNFFPKQPESNRVLALLSIQVFEIVLARAKLLGMGLPREYLRDKPTKTRLQGSKRDRYPVAPTNGGRG
jgi:hypothetical protein